MTVIEELRRKALLLDQAAMLLRRDAEWYESESTQLRNEAARMDAEHELLSKSNKSKIL
ncbi:MAG: hypothetical protein ABFD75_13105 [Smithella sp.]